MARGGGERGGEGSGGHQQPVLQRNSPPSRRELPAATPAVRQPLTCTLPAARTWGRHHGAQTRRCTWRNTQCDHHRGKESELPATRYSSTQPPSERFRICGNTSNSFTQTTGGKEMLVTCSNTGMGFQYNHRGGGGDGGEGGEERKA